MSRRQQWGGRRVQALRTKWEQNMPLTCCRCGRDIWPEQDWHVDHYPVPKKKLLALGENIYDERWLRPAHATCNMRAGARTRFFGPARTPRAPFPSARPDPISPLRFTRTASIYSEEARNAAETP